MCYSGKCKNEDHMGNCTINIGSNFNFGKLRCPPEMFPPEPNEIKKKKLQGLRNE